MTLIVGFVGTDGAVMAADSEATESKHSRFDVEKIWTEGGLLFGYSGNTSVRQGLEVAITATVAEKFGSSDAVDRWEARSALTAAIRPVLADAYSAYVGPDPMALAGALLVIGRDKDGYWLLEVDESNTATFYEKHGFQAIGSGSSAAYIGKGLLEHYQLLGRAVRQLRLVAFRTVNTCINVAGGGLGVGGEVRVWTSEANGPFRKADEKEISAMKDGVAKWTTVERESLDFSSKGRKEGEDTPIPDTLKPVKKPNK